MARSLLSHPPPAGGGTLSPSTASPLRPTDSRIFIDSPGDLFILDDLTWVASSGRRQHHGSGDHIVTPVDGLQYSLDEVVTADFSCDDGAGSGIDTCLGTVPAGDPIDTSTLGSHTFTVDADDLAATLRASRSPTSRPRGIRPGRSCPVQVPS